MKKYTVFFFLILSGAISLFATSVGSGTRNVSINGTVSSGGANGTNGSSWELDEDCGGNDAVAFFYTWDNTNLYLGWTGGNAAQQHIVWIDTDPKNLPLTGTGSTSTFNYGNIVATLPFTGNVFLNIEDDYDEIRTNTSGTWSGATSNTLNQFFSGDNIEITIPWSSIGGRPNSIYILSYINDTGGGGGDGFVYGGSPAAITSGDYDSGFSIASSAWFFSLIASGQAPNGNAGILPVTWQSFTATPQPAANHLAWATATERNNSHFEVERSADSRLWKVIGEVAGVGDSQQEQRYSFVDAQPLPGRSYYRLRQVDFDGQFDYSTIALAERSDKGALRAFPNPAASGEGLRLSWPADWPAAELLLYASDGRLLRRWPLTAGQTEQPLADALLPSGIYLARLVGPHAQELDVIKLWVE